MIREGMIAFPDDAELQEIWNETYRVICNHDTEAGKKYIANCIRVINDRGFLAGPQLQCSFNWVGTPEGWSYWANLQAALTKLPTMFKKKAVKIPDWR